MSEHDTTTRYLLLMRGTDWEHKLSPEDVQQFMGKFTAWMDDLNARGIIESAHPLASEGKHVSGKGGQNVADGPYAESKEAVGGFFLLAVADEAEALAIARTSPVLDYGGAVEVRPVIAMCSTMARAAEMAAEATP